MNENSMNAARASDEEILDGIRSRLAGVEPLVAAPPAWSPKGSAAAGRARGDRMTVRVQPRGAFGFGAALAILVVAVVAAASLGALGPRNPGTSGASPTQFMPVTTITYELVVPADSQLTAAQLDTTVRILKSRANFAHAAGLQVEAQPPNRVTVSVSGGVDVQALESLLGRTGRLEIVLLPPDVYGTAAAPGAKALPVKGDLIDPALPAQFTNADIDPDRFGVSQDRGSPDRSVIDFAFTPAAATRFADWTGQHVNDYFALVVDGVVQSVPYVYSRVDGSTGQISGYYTTSSAVETAAVLRYGALPYPVEEISVAATTPGPQASAPVSSSPLIIGKTPTGGPVTTIEYQLVPKGGSAPTRAELEQTVRMLAYRMTSFFPTDSYPDPSGLMLPDLSTVQGFSVTGVMPDQVIVRYRADVTTSGPFDMSAASIRAWLARPGRLALVDLPPVTYGTVGVPGPTPVPVAGTVVDPTLPAVITESDIASLGGGSDALVATVRMDFTEAGSATMAQFSQTATGHYVALTLDGIVLGTTAMAGQGRYGTLQMTISLEDGAGLSWLREDGNSPLPVPLMERSHSTVAASGSAPPSGPTVAPWPPVPPTPIVPTPNATGTNLVYVVKPGDTLSAIAARFNVSLASLEAANPLLVSDQLIVVGRTLNIPPP